MALDVKGTGMAGYEISHGGLTRHGAARLQQRALPEGLIRVFEEFASEMRCGSADCLYFDKPARKRLQLAMGGPRGLRFYEAWLNAYVVINDEGKMVTCGHRSRRLRRH